MSDASSGVAFHFQNFPQQRRAAVLGMWVFLVTEVLFFGGLFTVYSACRFLHAADFAEASRRLEVPLGGANTAILLASSLTMALAVRAAGLGRRRPTAAFLGATILLGLAFLGIKALEYADKARHHLFPGPGFLEGAPTRPGLEIFFSLYFAMTGLHALHMIAGIGFLAGLAFVALRSPLSPDRRTSFEVTGLYWHFVDIVWIFLFPLLYLVGRHAP